MDWAEVGAGRAGGVRPSVAAAQPSRRFSPSPRRKRDKGRETLARGRKKVQWGRRGGVKIRKSWACD